MQSHGRPTAPLSLQANYRIKEIDLSHNEFSDKGGEILGNMLGESPQREGLAKERDLANDLLSELHLLLLLLLSVLIIEETTPEIHCECGK